MSTRQEDHDSALAHAAPLLTVTVTNFNYARFLPRALDSILRQTFEDFEVLVIDNGSSDGSAGILQRYAQQDPRIRLVVHEDNVGPLASLRESCDLARGKYRVHVDADDWALSARAFERQVALLEASPDVAFVYASMVIKQEDGRTTSVSRPYPASCILPGAEALEAVLTFNLNHSGMMLRMDAYRATEGYALTARKCVDMRLAAELCGVGSCAYLDEELYAFQQHGMNIHLQPYWRLMRDEVLPLVDESYATIGVRDLGRAQAERARRRVVQTVLVHEPTQLVFSGRYRDGWRMWWESFRARPAATLLQRRSLALAGRTLVGECAYRACTSALRRFAAQQAR